MDSVVKQNLQSGISRAWVQRAHGKLTNEQFDYLVRGANFALRHLDLQYSIENRQLVDVDTGTKVEELAVSTADISPVDLAYIQRGYLQIKEVLDKEGLEVPAITKEAEKIRKL